MKLPYLTELATSRDYIDVFAGYNHNLRIGDGEFYDMKNLTSTSYPVLSPRGKRGVYNTPSNLQGIIAKDALCYVDGDTLVFNEYRVPDLILSTDEEDCPKQLISMGAYIVILPDAKWFNTEDLTHGEINVKFETVAPTRITLGTIDGDEFGDVSTEEPEEPENMDLWIDTSSEPHTLKQWSKSAGMWVTRATTYIRLESAGIGAKFEQYDGVNISGLKDVDLISDVLDDDGKNIPIEGNSAKQIAAIDGSFVIWNKGDDYIVIIGILDTAQTVINKITVTRQMPHMDFVIESQNRLWGCRYGKARNGEIVNEIYASKLGDFKNWNCFMGVSTDSYAVTVGTDGQFTGAITHLGYPLFFKEGFIHKVYGSYPAQYQVQTTACRGVQSGSSKSLAIVNEVLYYKARNGVCAYDGSLPIEISSQFGEELYSDAVAGCYGNKYYISMKDSTDNYVMFVYDTAKDLWHKEDNLKVDTFCSCNNELYYMSDGKICTMFGSGEVDASPIPWMAESGIIGTSMPDKKYISKISVRMSLDIGTKVYFYIKYDSMGEWEYISTMTGTTLRTFTVPIKPKRCDHFRIRIVGEGDAKIFSISKTIEQGSDV